ncbi:MAG: SOS response-associated peptidase [Saprospiraceae bacterium]
MCGRYSFAVSKEKVNKHFGLSIQDDLTKRYNIAPTQVAYVIANDDPEELQQFKWGLVPNWAKSADFGSNLINARSESIATKPSFRMSIRKNRCLILSDGFYEWKKYGSKKIPHRIISKKSQLLVFAGLWDEWQGEKTFTIITTTPNEEMKSIHNRMPVILPTIDDQKRWLSDMPLKEVLAMLKPVEDNTLKIYAVSDKLNKVDYDESDLWKEVKAPPTLFDFT